MPGGGTAGASHRRQKIDIRVVGHRVERWLRHWLNTRTRIPPTTRLHYTRSVELVLILYHGHYRLADLDGPLLRAAFAEIAKATNGKGRPQTASTLHHLRTTLRAARNLAVREELIESNPARHIEIAGFRKPHAQVWTDGRVEAWNQTGERPAVAVWDRGAARHKAEDPHATVPPPPAPTRMSR